MSHRDRDILLQSLWATPLTSAEIADHLGFKRASSVRQAAMRLNLPHRPPNRDTRHALERYMEIVAVRRAQQKRDAERAVQASRGDRAICMVCHGACPPNVDGHDACRGRKRRAA